MSAEELRANPMMSHLLDATDRGDDLGHFGRLVFAIVARHFLDEEDLVTRLMRGGAESEAAALALVEQVRERGYSPPRRERILEWQAEQTFQIVPHDDPDEANVYRDLRFPPEVYEHIQEYREERALAHGSAPHERHLR